MTLHTPVLLAACMAAVAGCGSSVDRPRSTASVASNAASTAASAPAKPHHVAPRHGTHHTQVPKARSAPVVAWPGFARQIERTCQTAPPPAAPARATRLTRGFAVGAVARIGRLRGRLGTLSAPQKARPVYVELTSTLQRLQTMYRIVTAGVIRAPRVRQALYRGIVTTTQQASGSALRIGAPTCATHA